LKDLLALQGDVQRKGHDLETLRKEVEAVGGSANVVDGQSSALPSNAIGLQQFLDIDDRWHKLSDGT